MEPNETIGTETEVANDPAGDPAGGLDSQWDSQNANETGEH